MGTVGWLTPNTTSEKELPMSLKISLGLKTVWQCQTRGAASNLGHT